MTLHGILFLVKLRKLDLENISIMDYLLRCFRFYIKLHSVVFVLWLAYLLLNYWGAIKVRPILLVSFLWLNVAFLILSVLYFVYKYLIQRKKDLMKVDVILTVIYNAVFLVVFLVDPFYLLAKAIG